MPLLFFFFPMILWTGLFRVSQDQQDECINAGVLKCRPLRIRHSSRRRR